MSLRRKYRFEHVRQEPCRGGGRALVPRLLICRKGAARRLAERPACQVDERDTIFRIATGEANSGTRTDAEVGAPVNYPLAAARQHGRSGKAASVEKSEVEKEEPFGEVFEDFRVVWVAERLQDGKWTARYCWQHGTSDAAGKALQEAVLNGKSRRLLGQFDTEVDTIAAIKEAVLLEAKWVPPRA